LKWDGKPKEPVEELKNEDEYMSDKDSDDEGAGM
jgi:hypothetical protein